MGVAQLESEPCAQPDATGKAESGSECEQQVGPLDAVLLSLQTRAVNA